MNRLLLALVGLALLLPGAASASELLDRDATGVRLRVDDEGRALISYTAQGKPHVVLASGAVDALPPARGARQVRFTIDYSAEDQVASFATTCGRYTGPRLAWLVTACTASDGSHWALQAWQRVLPNYGVAAAGTRAVKELRLSHWTTGPATLEIWPTWAYRKQHRLVGRLTHAGAGVHGFAATRAGAPLDDFGRNVYIDTLDSAYGAGWQRENSVLTHGPAGTFCYGFFRHGTRPEGTGRRYRVTVIGPGVTPDVSWEGAGPGTYSEAADARTSAPRAEVAAVDPLCP